MKYGFKVGDKIRLKPWSSLRYYFSMPKKDYEAVEKKDCLVIKEVHHSAGEEFGRICKITYEDGSRTPGNWSYLESMFEHCTIDLHTKLI